MEDFEQIILHTIEYNPSRITYVEDNSSISVKAILRFLIVKVKKVFTKCLKK